MGWRSGAAKRLSLVAGTAIFAMACGTAASRGDDKPKELKVRCLVTILEQVQLPAREAGVLDKLTVSEGMLVEAGQEIGILDQDRAELERRHAQIELHVAQKNSENDVNVRYARAAWAVAKAEVARAEEAITRVPGSVTRSELEEKRLAAERAKLQIEQAERDQEVAVVTTDGRKNLVDLANVNVERRRIVSPIKGIVVEQYRHAGEWLNPGDPVVRLLRIDRLRVEGFLDAAHFGREIEGCEVVVEVELPGGQTGRFPGRVTFVSPEIEPTTGEVRIKADVENPDLALRPGARALMTIRLQPLPQLPD